MSEKEKKVSGAEAENESESAPKAAKEDNKDEKKEKRAQKLLEKELEDAKSEIEKLKKENQEQNDSYLRMLAEYDNFRKRAQKEKESIYSDGIADAVEKLLPVLDNLERASDTDSSSDAQSVIDGVKKILEQASGVFEKLGVTEIPAKGEKFDPELHNAVMHEESEEYDENTVSDVFLKGYKIGDKVIRHSMVKVMN